MRILLVGDIFGAYGREMFFRKLAELRKDLGINFVVANGENIAHGRGITTNYYRWLIEQHVDVVTLGNHAFSNQDILKNINEASKLVRPINFPDGCPGQGFVTLNYNGIKITVFQVMGRTFEGTPLDCPFKKTDELLKNTDSDLYICDFHGEATSEKIAYGLHYDGRVHIIAGTHTHVQTNDAHILDNGTAYITDLGMTGARDGVIGVEPKNIIKRLTTGMLVRHLPMEKGKKQFCGLLVDINEKNHKVTKCDIINIVE